MMQRWGKVWESPSKRPLNLWPAAQSSWKCLQFSFLFPKHKFVGTWNFAKEIFAWSTGYWCVVVYWARGYAGQTCSQQQFNCRRCARGCAELPHQGCRFPAFCQNPSGLSAPCFCTMATSEWLACALTRWAIYPSECVAPQVPPPRRAPLPAFQALSHMNISTQVLK